MPANERRDGLIALISRKLITGKTVSEFTVSNKDHPSEEIYPIPEWDIPKGAYIFFRADRPQRAKIVQ
jgi:hypothetical protein